MKRALLSCLSFLLLSTSCFSQSKSSPDKEIHWMNLDEVQVAMNKQPKKVWIDVYTDWCGWCKRMDKTTFQNPNVIKYMNEHFYAVKLNAEQHGDIRFMGKMYRYDPSDRTHPFAKELLHDQLSYPTTVFMEENFRSPQLIPGYQDVKTMEMILKYLGEGLYKKEPFPQYQAGFKPEWN
ncbi:MAG: DUF255 domain-containing protein [Bacteroidetes bacterium]|nr:DUF255 domain-containing protein [Bacteroidota bacterium]